MVEIGEGRERSESETRILKGETEKVEKRMEGVEKDLDEIKASIARVEAKDTKLASIMGERLEAKEREKGEIRNEAQEIASRLHQVLDQITLIKQVNESNRKEVERYEPFAASPDDMSSVKDAEQHIEKNEEKIRELTNEGTQLQSRLEALYSSGVSFFNF